MNALQVLVRSACVPEASMAEGEPSAADSTAAAVAMDGQAPVPPESAPSVHPTVSVK